MPWKMFLVEPAGIFRRSLRRFWNYGLGRHSGHYHDASVVIKEQCSCPEPGGRSTSGEGWEDDPRWPARCACGYAFVPEDHRQMNEELLYKGAPDGRLYTLRSHPPGAIWRAIWMEKETENPYAAPDGKVWCLKLPGDTEWLIYSFSSGPDRRKWDVHGTLPNITVHPSVNAEGYYHGWIKDGVISEDCEGRKFPGVARTA